MITCWRCGGTGKRDDDPNGTCMACYGTGEVDEEEEEW